MGEENPNLSVVIGGSNDFNRRMTVAAHQRIHATIRGGNIAETRSLVLSHRPNVLVVEVGLSSSAGDVNWLRTLLEELRERDSNLYVAVAITSAHKFALAGSLLFADEESLAPSGLIDNIIISPPAGVPSSISIEEQFRDLLRLVAELETHQRNLPALWEANWAPTMCDPSSRAVWMRWLPRYAGYINENPIIVGPTGTGKTRLAAAIHLLSGRSGPFVGITPRDFSSMELVQAELFGAVAGAYTGAVDKWGLVHKAEKGTLFIDELQSIDAELQGKLITFIENKTYRRVGGAESHKANVRFVFATNRPLDELVAEGKLRDDFAYRLERLQLHLHPLRDRRLDIGAGICFAMAKVQRERSAARSGSKRLEGLSAEAYRRLYSADWPGNLRQLENTMARVIEYANIAGETFVSERSAQRVLRGLLGQEDFLSDNIFVSAARQTARTANESGYPSLADCLAGFSEHARALALEHTGGDAKEAAKLLNDSEKVVELFRAARLNG